MKNKLSYVHRMKKHNVWGKLDYREFREFGMEPLVTGYLASFRSGEMANVMFKSSQLEICGENERTGLAIGELVSFSVENIEVPPNARALKFKEEKFIDTLTRQEVKECSRLFLMGDGTSLYLP